MWYVVGGFPGQITDTLRHGHPPFGADNWVAKIRATDATR
jgi:hypothetical protein